MAKLREKIGSFNEDNLFVGLVSNIVTDKVLIPVNKNYIRGTLMALDASGKGVICDKSKTTGEDNPYGILCDDIDTKDGEEYTAVYLTGEFNINAITVGSGDAKDYKQKSRNVGIFLKDALL